MPDDVTVLAHSPTDASTDLAADLLATGVDWDIEPLLEGGQIDDLVDRAELLTAELAGLRGQIASFTVADLTACMRTFETLSDLLGRAGNYAALRFAVDTADPKNGARMARYEERTTAIWTQLLFFDLEWAALDDERADALLADPSLAFAAHHLRAKRRYRDHLLSEPEERILTEKSVTGASAWSRLFAELSSAITIELPDGAGSVRTAALEQGLAQLQHPDRAVRQAAAAAVTAGLAPGLRTRGFVLNTLVNDKAIDDRLRHYPTWISSLNLGNETTDESVEALVAAVQGRYDIPQRWYRMKAQILGLDRLADYDRMASIAATDTEIGWHEAREIVLDAYHSFSPDLASVAQRFFDERWIDAPTRPAKRPGAFCAYTVPSHHPYLLLNWTGRTRDVLTLAHELGHGLHAYLAREQGIFHQVTPLTVAETASVFGETVTNGRLLSALDDPNDRLALLASVVEDSIATVFRQVAMNRFEHATHTARRTEGELSLDHINELWAGTQAEMLGDAVEVTEGYRTWWSYIPHFINTPGYVYAYAYGQLLALSVYRRYEEQGDAFVPRYLELLRAGGSVPPAELGRIVDCDLDDPEFWYGGLAIIDAKVTAAEETARTAGRL
jgi:oligoendopeptidase F